MINIKNAAILTVALALLVGIGLYISHEVSANDTTNFPPLVQRFIERFNLDENEVSEFISDVHQERHQEREALFLEKLDQAVEEGSITEEQKTLLLEKHKEMSQNWEEFMNLSPEEKRLRMQTRKEEVQRWAEENDIDLSQIHPEKEEGLGKGFHKGFRFGHDAVSE